MKKIIAVGLISAFLGSCDYTNKSNGNIDAAFRSPDTVTFGGNSHQREMADPANWIFKKDLHSGSTKEAAEKDTTNNADTTAVNTKK